MQDQASRPTQLETQQPEAPPKVYKPFASIAQMERSRRLVAEGFIKQESFDAQLAVTDVENLPERLHPKKS